MAEKEKKGIRGSDWETNISSIRLKKFKAFKDSGTIPLKPLTFIVGKNSSGKSTILKSIAAFSQTVQRYRGIDVNHHTFRDKFPFGEHQLNSKGKYVDVGLFEDICNNTGRRIQHMKDRSKNRSFTVSFGCGTATTRRMLRMIGLSDNSKNRKMAEGLWSSYEFSPSADGVDSNLKSISTGRLDDRGNINYNKETIFKMKTDRRSKKWNVEFLNDEILTSDFKEINIPDRFERFEEENERLSKMFKQAGLDLIELDLDQLYPSVANLAKINHAILSPLTIEKLPHVRKFLTSLRMQKMIATEKEREAWTAKQLNKSKKPDGVCKLTKREALFFMYRMIINTYEKKIAPLTVATQILERELGTVNYIGPLRDEPRRELHEHSSETQDIGTRGENAVQYLHKADPKTKNLLNKSLQKMGVGQKTITDHLRSRRGKSGFVQLYLELEDGSERQLVDLGFGVSQVLPVLLECCVRENSTILLEQPELHLHPGLQTELAEILMDSCDRQNQIIVESHSVNAIERIRRRIREGKLDHRAVNVIYVKDGKYGSLTFNMEFDEDGDFTEPWPDDDGFFGEREKELFSDYF